MGREVFGMLCLCNPLYMVAERVRSRGPGNTYLKFLQYDKVFALLILIFIVVVLIDLLSLAVRSFVNEEGDVRKPTWLNMLIQARKRRSKSGDIA